MFAKSASYLATAFALNFVSSPAAAQDYAAFAGSGNLPAYIYVNDAFSSSTSRIGWFDNSGSHIANNDNYITSESYLGGAYRSFFDFASVPNADSVRFFILPFTWIIPEGKQITLSLYDVSSAIDRSQDYMGRTDIFDDLGTGRLFGSATFTAEPAGYTELDLNGVGVTEFNRLGDLGERFVVGAVATLSDAPAVPPPSVPEPSSWVSMILGFGLIGIFSRRRSRSASRLG